MDNDIELVKSQNRLLLTEEGLQPDSPEAIASLQNVYKRFGKVEALKGISLQIFPGELLALLGPNGSGKTTTINILLGRRRADQGEVLLYGQDPRLPQARKQIGVTPQETDFPGTLKVKEILKLVQLHYPYPLSIQEVLERFGLAGLEERQTGGLSGGQKRRLALALAFIGNPGAVFLDEPTVGLDVEARRGIWQEMRAFVQKGGAILLTTHYLEEVEALASRVVIIDKGQCIGEGSVEEIKARVALKQVHFAASRLPELPGVVHVEQVNGKYILSTADADAVVRSLVQQEIDFQDLEVAPMKLEDV